MRCMYITVYCLLICLLYVNVSDAALLPCHSLALSQHKNEEWEWRFSYNNNSLHLDDNNNNNNKSSSFISYTFACTLYEPRHHMYREPEDIRAASTVLSIEDPQFTLQEFISPEALLIPLGPHKLNWQEPLRNQQKLITTNENNFMMHENPQVAHTLYNKLAKGQNSMLSLHRSPKEQENEFTHYLLTKIAHELRRYFLQISKQILCYPWYHPIALQQLFYERHVEIRYVVGKYTRSTWVYSNGDEGNENYLKFRNNNNNNSLANTFEKELTNTDFLEDDAYELQRDSAHNLLHTGLYKTVRIVSFPPSLNTHLFESEKKEHHNEIQKESQTRRNNNDSNENNVIGKTHNSNSGSKTYNTELVCNRTSFSQAQKTIKEYKSVVQIVNSFLSNTQRTTTTHKHEKSEKILGSYTLERLTALIRWVYYKFIEDSHYQWENLGMLDKEVNLLLLLEEQEKEQKQAAKPFHSSHLRNEYDRNRNNGKDNNDDKSPEETVYYKNNNAHDIMTNNHIRTKINALQTRAKSALAFLTSTREELGPLLYNDKNNYDNDNGNIDVDKFERKREYRTNMKKVNNRHTLSSASSFDVLKKETVIDKRAPSLMPFFSINQFLLSALQSLFTTSTSSESTFSSSSATTTYSKIPSWILQWIGKRTLATSHKLTYQSFTSLHTLLSSSSSAAAAAAAATATLKPKLQKESELERPEISEYSRRSKDDSDVLKVYHTKVWFHFTASLPASRSLCLAVEAVPHALTTSETSSSSSSSSSSNTLQKYEAKEDGVTDIQYFNYYDDHRFNDTNEQDEWENMEFSKDGMAKTFSGPNKTIAPTYARTQTSDYNADSESNSKRVRFANEEKNNINRSGVDVFVSQSIHFDQTWLKLFVTWLILYYTKTFLVNSYIIHFILAGLCGLLVLTVLAIVYVVRKVKQMTVGQASMVLVLAMGGVTAFTEGVLVLLRHYAETIQEHLMGEWAVYLLLGLLLVAACSMLAARLLFPPSSLQMASKICITVITYSLLLLTFIRRREATVLTCITGMLIRWQVRRRWSCLLNWPRWYNNKENTGVTSTRSLWRAREDCLAKTTAITTPSRLSPSPSSFCKSRISPSKWECEKEQKNDMELTYHSRLPHEESLPSTSRAKIANASGPDLKSVVPLAKSKQMLDVSDHLTQSSKTKSKSKSKSKSNSNSHSRNISCERDEPTDDLPPCAKREQRYITPLVEEGHRYCGMPNRAGDRKSKSTTVKNYYTPLSHAEKMRCYSEEGVSFTRKALEELAQRLRESPSSYVSKVRDPNNVARWAGSQYESSFSDNSSSDNNNKSNINSDHDNSSDDNNS